MPFKDILQNLGDAVAGVDREAAFMEGQQARSEIDYTRSQTDAAIELARQRRAQAERELMINEARARVREMDPAAMADQGMGDIVVSELGSSYAGATQGRLREQEHGFRGTIADPAGDQATRIAAAQAVSPSRLSGEGLGDEVAWEVVQGEDGNPVLVPAAQAGGRTPMTRLNPAANRAGSEGDGLFESADTNAIRGAVADYFGGTYDPITQRIGGLNPSQSQQALQITALASQLFGSGRAPDHGTAVAMAIVQLFPEAGARLDQRIFDTETPIGDSIEDDAGGDIPEGTTATNPSTGERLIMRGGQWVPLE